MTRMPKQLIVMPIKQDNGEIWFEAREDLKGFEQQGKVGVYKLVEVKTLKIENKLE